MSVMVDRLCKLKDELSALSNLTDESKYKMKDRWIERAKILLGESLDGMADKFIQRIEGISFNAPCFAIVSGGECAFDCADESVSNKVFQNGISECHKLMDECIQERFRLERVFSSEVDAES